MAFVVFCLFVFFFAFFSLSFYMCQLILSCMNRVSSQENLSSGKTQTTESTEATEAS